ncbi:MAG: hypothetical protein QFE16_05390 [Pseudomonadota bacterium]|nr:hypothetical protein [Pseudomonadota bacterium]
MTIKVSRLYRKDSGVFYLRIKVPAELKAVLGKGEIHRSLSTKDPVLARSLALGANSALELQRHQRDTARRQAATPDGGILPQGHADSVNGLLQALSGPRRYGLRRLRPSDVLSRARPGSIQPLSLGAP